MGMKKIFSLWSIAITAFVISGPAPANASQENSIVIIDSGFSSQEISQNVILELCITTTRGCNNGQNVQIGAGSAGSAVAISERSSSDWNHGTEMVKQVIAVNPDAKIIVIRNARVFPNGAILPGGESSVEAALSWVYQNRSKYNISAVAMSRGDNRYFANDRVVSRLEASTELYVRQLSSAVSTRTADRLNRLLAENRQSFASLPAKVCPASNRLKALVSDLAANGVASMFATGNDFNARFVDAPACLDEVVAVAASDSSGKVLPMSNVAPNTDFAVEAPNTSIATARLAGRWSLVYNGSYNSTYDLIAKSGSNSDSWSAIFVP